MKIFEHKVALTLKPHSGVRLDPRRHNVRFLGCGSKVKLRDSPRETQTQVQTDRQTGPILLPRRLTREVITQNISLVGNYFRMWWEYTLVYFPNIYSCHFEAFHNCCLSQKTNLAPCTGGGTMKHESWTNCLPRHPSWSPPELLR